MGRTARHRCRPTSSDPRPSTGYQLEIVSLISWMKVHGWKPACRLAPACFPNTGRGLMAAQNMSVGQPLAIVPGCLVITVDKVSASPFGKNFTSMYKTQQVLATYLMFERHRGSESFWYNYILSLPTTISNAAYCIAENLPDDLSEKVLDHQNTILTTFNQIMSEMSSVVCLHCSDIFSNIFTYKAYKWAWSIVNTRAVYISPDCSLNNKIKLSDINNLALAPYIDMFNHSPVACVRATVNRLNGAYTIVTEKLFKKHSEVFINYGPHSNTKLFLEYGFIVPSNPQDYINLSVDEIISKTGKILNKNRMEKLKTHGLLDGHYCTSEGLSWSARILIYLLIYSDRLNDEELKNRVYANMFDQSEIQAISKIGTIIVKTKLEETKHWELNMLSVLEKNQEEKKTGFGVSTELIKENLRLLENCLQSLNV